MGYELYIGPTGTSPGLPSSTIVKALAGFGIRCTEELDEFGCWLLLDGFESTLNLTIKDGLANFVGFRFSMQDDPSLIEKISEAFKGLSWTVSDDEGLL